MTPSIERPPCPRSRRAWLLHGVTLLALLTLLPGCPFIMDWPTRVEPSPPPTTGFVDPLPDAGPSPDVNDTWQVDSGPAEPWDSGPSRVWDTGNNATPDVWRRQPNRFPPVTGAFVVGNVTAQTRVVRMRALRATVQMDCDAIESAPQLALRPSHFAPAQTWLVASGRAVPLSQRATGACTAVLIDGTGVPQRLVFWRHTEWPQTTIPSTVAGAKNTTRHIGIIALEGAAAWDTHAALVAAPSLFDPVAAAGCAMPTAEQDLTWTALPSGPQTLIDVLTAPDGCSALDLLTDLGVKRVYICMPVGMLPFGAGDDLYIAALATGHNVLPITGVELLGDSGHVRMGRGADIVYFGKGDAKIAVTKGCPAVHDEEDTYARALSIDIQEPGKPAVQLDNGNTHTLADGGKLHLVRAIERLVWDSATTIAVKENRHIESVWSKP